MPITSPQLSALYRNSHDLMRNIDGLQPQEAFDELLKYLFMKESADEANHRFPSCVPAILHQEAVSINETVVNDLRRQLGVFLSRANSWSSEMWQDKAFHLSDTALLSVHELFEDVDFTTVDLDKRSAALNELISSELRRGLGIFPTPDAVVRMMVEIMDPPVTARILDPACGTGTFLIETIRRWRNSAPAIASHSVWGVDKSARMLLLSELNLGHDKRTIYGRVLADSLYHPPPTLFDELDEGFDYILTNPPFGVIVDRNKQDMTPFQTCKSHDGSIVKRQQSEVIFVEQCLKYLKPGGSLGIVLPRSVVSNSSLAAARQALSTLGYVEAIVNLPPETFAMSGAQTNTVVLFLRRYESAAQKEEPVAIACADIDNVGFDSTGRHREGNQLESVSIALKGATNGKSSDAHVRLLPAIAKMFSITNLPALLSRRLVAPDRGDAIPLGELIEIATNGKTPARGSYTSDGLFLVKVGNLTGGGIDWSPRDRNFISGAELVKRKEDTRLMLRENDILFTSSAHSPVYIGKKADIVDTVPMWLGGEASFVGEVMMLRPKAGFDPMVLLAYLRLPSVQRQLQSMVRGQTAHLHPKDLLQWPVPKLLLEPPLVLRNLADQIRIQAHLSEKLNALAFEQRTAVAAAEKLLK